MLKFFIVSKSNVISGAMKEGILNRYHSSVEDENVIEFNYIGNSFGREALYLFQHVAEAIEAEIKKNDWVHDRFIGILDVEHLTTAKDIQSLTSMQGMLILAFPEIQWILLYKDAWLWDDSEQTSIGKSITLDLAVKLCKGGHTPLFDGDGLRSILIERAHGNKNLDPKKFHYYRSDVAFSIDEEAHFAYINAYTAYRFGYRAFAIFSGTCMDELCWKKEDGNAREIPTVEGATPDESQTTVVFEDVCLAFPDKNTDHINLSKFGSMRNENYPRLKGADLRVITTAAQEDEKVGQDGAEKLTITDFFKGYFHSAKRYSRIANVGIHNWRCLRNTAERILFNVTGGWWLGYWLIYLILFSSVISILVYVFFCHTIWIGLAALIVFIFLGVWKSEVNIKIKRFLGRIPAIATFIRQRQQWPFLPKRYQNHFPNKNIFEHNKTYWEIARKPLAGIFGLRNKCGLPNGRNFRGMYDSQGVFDLYKRAKHGNFAIETKEQASDSHAAPGVVLELATRLLRRAERMNGSIIDAEGAIHGAVLANTACELLDYKTPSLSIEALNWKHYYEVLAECEFVGVRARLDMADRYIDIHNFMTRNCRSEDGTVRASVFTSGMAEIVDNLGKLLREKGKLEEASYFIMQSRKLHRQLLSPFIRSLLAYPEWVLRNKWNFAISLSGFFILFWMYRYFKIDANLEEAFKNTYTAMIGRLNVSTPQHEIVMLMARQIGVLHLAFIAAYFMGFMQRK